MYYYLKLKTKEGPRYLVMSQGFILNRLLAKRMLISSRNIKAFSEYFRKTKPIQSQQVYLRTHTGLNGYCFITLNGNIVTGGETKRKAIQVVKKYLPVYQIK